MHYVDVRWYTGICQCSIIYMYMSVFDGAHVYVGVRWYVYVIYICIYIYVLDG